MAIRANDRSYKKRRRNPDPSTLGRGPAKPKPRAFACPRRLGLAVPRRSDRDERVKHFLRGGGDTLDGEVERFRICFGRSVEAGQLSNELQRRGLYLVRGCGRIEIEKCFDISTHISLILRNPTQGQMGQSLLRNIRYH